MRRAVLGLFMLAASTSAHADWASGGGQVLQDAQNPWFLQNTETVNVCVIWDQDNFHPVDTDVSGLINRFQVAADYWKQEFAKSHVVGNFVKVADQRFNVSEVALVRRGSAAPSARCLAADLRVQFGWLSADQIDFFNTKMGGVQRYLAATIRTEYDRMELRGKGFIYLKPDSGPLSAPMPGIVTNPWELGLGYLINQALQHELGHVFGIPHKGAETIMAVDYLERTFSLEHAAEAANYQYDNGFFAWNMTEGSEIRSFCGIRRGWKQFLAIPDGHDCYRVKFSGDKVVFETGELPDGAGTWSERGSLTYDRRITFMWDEAVRIFLPWEQRVITRFPDGAGKAPWLMGPMIKNSELAGTFASSDGSLNRKVLITLSPSGLGFASSRFSVEIDGRWYWNLDWEN